MTGNWSLQLEDGVHAVHAEASYVTGQLLVTWDNTLLEARTIWWMTGEIRTFQKAGMFSCSASVDLGILGTSFSPWMALR